MKNDQFLVKKVTPVGKHYPNVIEMVFNTKFVLDAKGKIFPLEMHQI